jgi:hypothetical protein
MYRCACMCAHVQYPVEASAEEVALEVSAVREAVGRLCPLHVTLERVLINSAGVVLACWQLSHGPSITSLRSELQVCTTLVCALLR